MHLRYNEHPNLERLNSISTGFYTQHVQNLLTAFKYSKEIIYNYGIFHWNIIYTSVYMCTNIIGTHFPWLYLEDEMCTLYSGKYSKNSTSEVIQQSHSLLQFSQWFLLINNFTSIYRISSFSKVRRYTVQFLPQETKSHFSFLQADISVSKFNAKCIALCVHYHRPSKHWYCKFKPHIQHKICIYFPPLSIILFTIIIPMWGFCHRLSTHSYETMLRILTNVFVD